MKTIDVEVDLDDWSSDELIEELQDRNYNFIKEIDLEEAIDYVESCGYTIERGDNIVEDLDLEELISNFLSADFTKRDLILKSSRCDFK